MAMAMTMTIRDPGGRLIGKLIAFDAVMNQSWFDKNSDMDESPVQQ
jgi:hypothetical protein